MKDAKAKSLMDDVVVNSVSHHALCRCIERRLPLDALAGHARGVTTVFSRSGRTITVYPQSSRCSFVPGHFELGERLEFPAALVRDTYAFGAPNDFPEVAVEAQSNTFLEREGARSSAFVPRTACTQGYTARPC